MHKIYVGLVIAASATPVDAATENTHAKNVQYLSELVGNYDLATPVEFVDGRVMTLGEAIELTAARAGDIDLSAISASAVGGTGGPAVGDIWVLEIGTGGCTANVVAPQPVFQAVHGQLWVYSGGVGDLATSQGDITLFIDWTTKGVTGGSYFNTAGFTLTGSQDFFCFSFFGLHIAFPFGDGVAQLN